MVKAVAEERGWEHRRHAQLIGVVRRVVEETDDQELWISFGMARGLRENFYEDELGASDVDYHLVYISQFVDKMRALVDGNKPPESGRPSP